MRADFFSHASSLLSRFSEYSEADLTHEASKLLSEKANLTEALGVSAQFGGLMQATYEEMVESKTFEMPSGGLLEPGTIVAIIMLIVWGIVICMWCFALLLPAEYLPNIGGVLLQEGSEAEEKEAGPKLMKKVAKKLFETKFGKGSGADLQLCMDEMSSKGPSLMKETGLDLSALKQELKGSKKDPKQQVKIIGKLMTGFMATHGATIASHGLDELGIGSCGKVFCAGDLRYKLDASGFHRCEWNCPASFLPDDSFDSMAQSAKKTLVSFEDVAASDSELIEKIEDETTEDLSKVKKTTLWRMIRGIQIASQNAYVSNPWSPEGLQIVKMPNAATFSMSDMRPASLYYKGICIPEQEYFKKHKVAIVNASNARVPQGTVVKLDWIQTTGTGAGAYFTYGEDQIWLSLTDLNFGLIPMKDGMLDSGAVQWLAATNRSLRVANRSVLDPSGREFGLAV